MKVLTFNEFFHIRNYTPCHQNTNFHQYKVKVFELWNLKNKFTWKILDNKGINIYEGDSLSSVLKLIADDYEN